MTGGNIYRITRIVKQVMIHACFKETANRKKKEKCWKLRHICYQGKEKIKGSENISPSIREVKISGMFDNTCAVIK